MLLKSQERWGIAWSVDSRTAGFRIVGHGNSLRVECRIPGADANPYLAFAATLAAGAGRDREEDRTSRPFHRKRLLPTRTADLPNDSSLVLYAPVCLLPVK
ncbi:MAG: glutamine synthetase [Armatimonadetes bacterium]|nr:glutamine synthetase [Armatimonadota bacterium]